VQHENGTFAQVEGTVEQVVQWLRLIVETAGALIVALGMVLALVAFVRILLRRRDPTANEASFNRVRLTLARYLALALEFQLAADILSTAIAPSWEAIGKLGAIAIIRTVLNYFLEREMEAEARSLDRLDPDERSPRMT
jgi:uncharacterized membrane protein